MLHKYVTYIVLYCVFKRSPSLHISIKCVKSSLRPYNKVSECVWENRRIASILRKEFKVLKGMFLL